MAPPSEPTEALSVDPSGVVSVATELVRSEVGHFTVARGRCEVHSVCLRSVPEVGLRPYVEAPCLSSSQRLRQRWTSVFSIRSSQRRFSALASLVPCTEVITHTAPSHTAPSHATPSHTAPSHTPPLTHCLTHHPLTHCPLTHCLTQHHSLTHTTPHTHTPLPSHCPLTLPPHMPPPLRSESSDE